MAAQAAVTRSVTLNRALAEMDSSWHNKNIMQEKYPYVYIMANKRNGTLYTGVTSDLPARMWQHRNNSSKGFSEKYQVHKLVYFEEHGEMLSAIHREKRMKKWTRKTKIMLIEKNNLKWRDLYDDIVG